jgi:hypothetical protein
LLLHLAHAVPIATAILAAFMIERDPTDKEADQQPGHSGASSNRRDHALATRR